jgi:tryptophanase
VMEKSKSLAGLKIVSAPNVLRHFTARFEPMAPVTV